MVTHGGQVTDAIKEMRVSVGSNTDLEGGFSAVRQWNQIRQQLTVVWSKSVAMNVNYAVLEA
jgi:hypothetical protein